MLTSRNFVNIYLIFLGLFVIVDNVSGKIFKKCELATTLRDQGVPKDQIPSWLCIVKHESNFDTKAVNQKTWDYGIFQISSIYWCQKGKQPGKGCNVSCDQLLDDNITDDITCSRKVYDETQRLKGNGFTAWTAYNTYCAGKDLGSYVQGCNI